MVNKPYFLHLLRDHLLQIDDYWISFRTNYQFIKWNPQCKLKNLITSRSKILQNVEDFSLRCYLPKNFASFCSLLFSQTQLPLAYQLL